MGSAEMGVVGPGKLGYVSLTITDWAMYQQFLPKVGWGGGLALDGHTGAVIFCGFWGAAGQQDADVCHNPFC
jgi:hypothetical protein